MSVNASTHVESLITKYLKGPVEDFLSRPRKDLRGDILRIGFMLHARKEISIEVTKDLDILSSLLEWVHAGSLIIDDIQDDSLERRGDQCLHRKYGMPCALNAANWMYFEALKSFDHISLNESQKLKMMTLTLDVMTKAHQGQAIDIMTNVSEVSREDIFQLGMEGHDLKSGALFSLSLSLGALLADDQVDLDKLRELGSSIGRSLQRFDDLGNFNVQGKSSKSLEDLKLGRPTWPWMYVAKYRCESDFKKFREVVSELPNTRELEVFLSETNLRDEALKLARDLHSEIESTLDTSFPGFYKEQGLEQLKNILKRVSYAYV